MDGDALQTLFTGLLLVVRAGIRSRHKPNELKQDLEEVLPTLTRARTYTHFPCPALFLFVVLIVLSMGVVGTEDACGAVSVARECDSESS